MKNGTNNRIAFVHLTSRIKQTIIAMLSVTFGVSMYICMNGFMSGVNDTQTELAFSTLAHVRIYNDGEKAKTNFITLSDNSNTLVNVRNPKTIQYTEGIKNSAKIIEALSNYPEIEAVTPQINLSVFYRNGAMKINGSLSGVDVINENKLFNTSGYMTKGKWEDLEYRTDGIIIGIGLAKKLGVGFNDNITLSTSEGITKNFKVIGIIEFTIASIDDRKGFINISSARSLLSKNMGYVSDLQIKIFDFNIARESAQSIQPAIPYKVEAWQEASGQLEVGSELRNIIAISVSMALLIVAGFGIYNIMNMTVNEKMKDIAILKAMGYEGDDIVQIFLSQSIIIGIFGGVVGILIGFGLSAIIDHIPFQLAVMDTYPMSYNLTDYGLSFFFGFLTTFIAGYLPAKKASKVDPVEIIRA
jgi:lipoprotein-releasing system permease protein